MEFVRTIEALKLYGQLIVQEAQKNLAEKMKKGNSFGVTNNTGNLSRSLKVLDTPCGISISMLDYGQAVDEGRRPGKGIPPVILEKWVEQKLRADEDPDSVAYMINRKIKRFGIKPTNFLGNAFATVDKMEIPEVHDALFEDLMESLKEKTC